LYYYITQREQQDKEEKMSPGLLVLILAGIISWNYQPIKAELAAAADKINHRTTMGDSASRSQGFSSSRPTPTPAIVSNPLGGIPAAPERRVVLSRPWAYSTKNDAAGSDAQAMARQYPDLFK
jgi:hypothetical protein